VSKHEAFEQDRDEYGRTSFMAPGLPRGPGKRFALAVRIDGISN